MDIHLSGMILQMILYREIRMYWQLKSGMKGGTADGTPVRAFTGMSGSQPHPQSISVIGAHL